MHQSVTRPTRSEFGSLDVWWQEPFTGLGMSQKGLLASTQCALSLLEDTLLPEKGRLPWK